MLHLATQWPQKLGSTASYPQVPASSSDVCVVTIRNRADGAPDIYRVVAECVGAGSHISGRGGSDLCSNRTYATNDADSVLRCVCTKKTSSTLWQKIKASSRPRRKKNISELEDAEESELKSIRMST